MMKTRITKYWIILLSALLLTLMLTPTVSAQGPTPGAQVHFGDDVTLTEGDLVEGDVVIFGGSFTMAAGSEVEGNIVVFGGDVKIDGDVEGDVAALGGDVKIKDRAKIDGDVATLGGKVSVSSEASISGVVADGLNFSIGSDNFTIPSLPEIKTPDVRETVEIRIPDNAERGGFFVWLGNFVGDGVENIFLAFILAGLSVLFILFFPTHTHLVQDTLLRATPISFVVGLVTFIAAGALTLLLAFLFWLILPLCGIFILAAVLAVSILAGWATIGKYLGTRIFNTFNNPAPSDISATFLGVVVLTLVVSTPFLDHLPLIGWMFSFVGFLVFMLVGSTGLGAVVLSRFGTQPYDPTQFATMMTHSKAQGNPPTNQA